jgi:peptidoglycan hydrolase-like protein with peptidoglycan-binding domain
MIVNDRQVPLSRDVHVGLRGEDVRERQNMLNALTDIAGVFGQSNLPELDDDGEFGSRTQMRVREFQGRNRLTVDGVIGPRTDTQMDALYLHRRLLGIGPLFV